MVQSIPLPKLAVFSLCPPTFSSQSSAARSAALKQQLQQVGSVSASCQAGAQQGEEEGNKAGWGKEPKPGAALGALTVPDTVLLCDPLLSRLLQRQGLEEGSGRCRCLAWCSRGA